MTIFNLSDFPGRRVIDGVGIQVFHPKGFMLDLGTGAPLVIADENERVTHYDLIGRVTFAATGNLGDVMLTRINFRTPYEVSPAAARPTQTTRWTVGPTFHLMLEKRMRVPAVPPNVALEMLPYAAEGEILQGSGTWVASLLVEGALFAEEGT